MFWFPFESFVRAAKLRMAWTVGPVVKRRSVGEEADEGANQPYVLRR
jgi:hypothetical protein